MPTRRSILQAGAASLVTALGGLRPAVAAAPPGRLIDVHHHLFPPALVQALDGIVPAALLPGTERSLAEIDAGGVSAAMISFPNDSIFTLPELRLTALIRDCNDYAMQVVKAHPGRYGLFASLPLPYLDAALKELTRAYDDLHADGILLITNYGDKWLGDPALAPLMAELNRRKAVVYTHPNAAACCKGLLRGVSDSIIEYETDTARTIASLLFSGSADRYPDIKFIFSHAGGTLPALIERFTTAPNAAPGLKDMMPKGVMHYLQSFHYDTAQAANPGALGALLNFVSDQQILFGTDFPYRHAPDQAQAIAAMGLAPAALQGIYSGNAQRLLPRLRT